MSQVNERKEKLTPFGDDHVHLLYAYSGASNQLIKIDKAYSGGEYKCPLCGKPVGTRKGEKYRNGFYHKKGEMSCFPQSSMIDKFIINLALEIFDNYKRITAPARSYRIKEKGNYVLTRLDIQEKLRFEKITKKEIRKGINGYLGIAYAKTFAEEPIALVFSHEGSPQEALICQLQDKGYSTLLVDLKSINFNSKNLEQDLDYLLNSNSENKKWYTSIDYPESLDYLKRVLPNNAFKKAIYVKNCDYDDCLKCKFCSEFPDQSLYCLKDYSEYKHKRYNIQPVPDYIHKMDLYIQWINDLKIKNLKNKKVLDNVFECIHFFTEKAPSKGQGSTLIEVGSNTKGYGSLNRSYKIYWGIGKENIAILLEPLTESKNDNTLLIKVFNIIDYFVPEVLHEIKVYKTKVNSPNQAKNIFKDFEPIDYNSSPWEEIISFTKNKQVLDGFISDLLKLIPEISLTKLSLIEDFLSEASELLNRNKELYKEDRVNILEPKVFSYTYYNINNNKGTLVFGLSGIEEQFGYKFYGAEWEVPLNSNHPITYYKFNNLKDFSQTSARRFNTWKKELCSSKEFSDRWNYFEDHFNNSNWIQYNDLNKSALSPLTLNSTVFGKILFNSDETLKEFWEEIEEKEYITYEDFRGILLSEKNFSDVTTTKFVQYLYKKFNLKPDDLVNLINS